MHESLFEVWDADIVQAHCNRPIGPKPHELKQLRQTYNICQAARFQSLRVRHIQSFHACASYSVLPLSNVSVLRSHGQSDQCFLLFTFFDVLRTKSTHEGATVWRRTFYPQLKEKARKTIDTCQERMNLQTRDAKRVVIQTNCPKKAPHNSEKTGMPCLCQGSSIVSRIYA